MPKLMEVLEHLDNRGDTLVARVPADDSCEIKYGAQLTVRESQVAVFFRDGRTVTAFAPGRYVLTTANIPVITKWVTQWGYGPTSPFRAEVYFVSVKLMPNLKWGTKQPILFRDEELHVVRLRSFGTFSLRVSNPVLFLNRMVGTQGFYTTEEIVEYLRSILVSRLMDVFGGVVKTVYNLPGYYDELAAALKGRVRDDFQAAGLEVVDFLIEAITPPEEVQQMIDERSSMAAIGDMDTYMRFKAAKSLQDAANNTGAGGLAAAGAGLGLGMMVPGMLAQSMGQRGFPPAMGGTAEPPKVVDPFETLSKLKGLLDQGALTPDEYASKKAELLKRM